MKKLSKMTPAERKKALTATVKELQKVMGFDPPLEPEGKNEAGLKELVKEGSEELVPADKLSAESEAIIKELGFMPNGEDKGEDKGEEVTEAEEVTADEGVEEDAQAEEVNLVEEINEAGTLAILKDLVNEFDEFKSLRKDLGKYKTKNHIDDLKDDMMEIIAAKNKPKPSKPKPAPAAKKTEDKKPSAPKPPKEKKESQPAYTRFDSVCDAIKEQNEYASLQELVDYADEIYTDKTGRNANPKESRYAVNITIRVLEKFGKAPTIK